MEVKKDYMNAIIQQVSVNFTLLCHCVSMWPHIIVLFPNITDLQECHRDEGIRGIFWPCLTKNAVILNT